MEVIKLPFGEQAPPEGDCISITVREDGRYDLNASALFRCGDVDQAESVSLIGGASYKSYDDAEAAGIAWAADHCVEQLFVSQMPMGSTSGP